MIVKQLAQDQHEDWNEIISFMNDYQHNQWHMIGRLVLLRRNQKSIQVRLAISKEGWNIWKLMFMKPFILLHYQKMVHTFQLQATLFTNDECQLYFGSWNILVFFGLFVYALLA